jgi:hypothetical protein
MLAIEVRATSSTPEYAVQWVDPAQSVEAKVAVFVFVAAHAPLTGLRWHRLNRLLSLVGPVSIGPPTSPSLGPSSPGARPADSGSNLVVHGGDSLRPWGGGSGEDDVLEGDG